MNIDRCRIIRVTGSKEAVLYEEYPVSGPVPEGKIVIPKSERICFKTTDPNEIDRELSFACILRLDAGLEIDECFLIRGKQVIPLSSEENCWTGTYYRWTPLLKVMTWIAYFTIYFGIAYLLISRL